MPKRPLHNNDDNEIDRTFGGRLVSALGSLFFSLPLCLGLGLMGGGMVPIHFWVWPIGLLAILGFFAPKLFPDIIAGIWRLIFKIIEWSRYW